MAPDYCLDSADACRITASQPVDRYAVACSVQGDLRTCLQVASNGVHNVGFIDKVKLHADLLGQLVHRETRSNLSSVFCSQHDRQWQQQ